MSCADVCLDMGYDFDANEFYVERVVIARKPHTCCECRFTIAPGQEYQRAAGKSDGFVWTVKTCCKCAEIRKALVCGSWEFGGLWDAIETGVFPEWRRSSPIDCLAKIETLASRDFIRHRFSEWAGDLGGAA